jgi:hypothetical protein
MYSGLPDMPRQKPDVASLASFDCTRMMSSPGTKFFWMLTTSNSKRSGVAPTKVVMP